MKDVGPPTKKRRDMKVIEKKEVYEGLCLSCKNASACTYPRTPDQPVLQCEEFDGYSASPLKVVPKPFPSTAIPPPSPLISNSEEENSNRLRGLCTLCECRETCTYPKPEGGVWHCEEYR